MTLRLEGPRGARVEELDEVLELVNLVFRTSRGLPPTMGEEFPLLFDAGNAENLRVIKHGGRAVSHVGIFECEALICGCKLKVGMVGSVCTHPDYRGRGLATRLLEDALGKMARDGVNVVMVSGIRRLYDRAGCAIAGRGYEVSFTRDELMAVGEGGVEVHGGGEERALEFARVYQREYVRYLRPYEHFKALLGGRAWCSEKPQARLPLLIYEEGELVGYVVAHVPEGGGGRGRVVEYAGSRSAVVRALRKLVEIRGLESLALKVPEWDVEMVVELRRHGLRVPARTTPLAGTVRLLNVEETFERLEPYFEERGVGVEVRVGEGAYRVRVGRDEVVARGDKELAWLVFGVPDEVHESFKGFMPSKPIAAPESFARAFPIPLPAYGLYYT